jgi:hypothetical protein
MGKRFSRARESRGPEAKGKAHKEPDCVTVLLQYCDSVVTLVLQSHYIDITVSQAIIYPV